MVLHILAWVLVLVCILGGIFVVFSYGITFGNDKTYQWVVAMISSFFSSVLITQPFYVSTFNYQKCILYSNLTPKILLVFFRLLF